MPEVQAQRRERLRALLRQREVEAALITSLVNVRYLTGLAASNAALLVGPGPAVLATDGRYATAAATAAPDIELAVGRHVAALLLDRAATAGVRRLGLEDHVVTLELLESLRRVAELDFVPLRRPVEELRVVKDDEEIRAIRVACEISARALAETLPAVVPGRTERGIARELEGRMVSLGAQAPAFPSIVAAGPHSAIPHHEPTDRPVERGDLLKVDFGARYAGYAADITRTFVVGAEPADWQAELHDLVFRAQRAGREALRPGTLVADVDAAARDVIAEAGYAEQFPHGLGHGVGLEIHEAPLLGYGSAAILRDRTPVTVEPGVYFPGRGGVRIEDTLVVRDDGGAELLTTTTKELLVLG
ncbi:MAG: aminopeptidase P family protein [Actinomycetota bacterium]|nr:aminopeptidase P family protein [Actinomycetota bacterium]